MLRSSIVAVVLGLLLAVSLVATACTKPAPASEPTSAPGTTSTITLKFNSFSYPTGADADTIRWYAAELEKRSAGRVKMELFFGGALAKDKETLGFAGKGIIDGGLLIPAYNPAELPLSGLTTVPYSGSALDVHRWALAELYRTYAPYRDEYEVKNNVRILFHWSASDVVGATPYPVRTLEDIKGKKIRSFGDWLTAAKLLGAAPVSISWPETYEAVSRGTVDGVFTAYDLLVPSKLYEVAPYLIDWSAGGFTGGAWIIGMDTWKKLPPDVRKIMDDLQPEANDMGFRTVVKLEKEYTEVMQKAGVRFYTPPPEELARWKKLVVPTIYDEIIARGAKAGLPAKEMFDKFMGLIEKHKPNSTYVRPFPK